jgi:NADPH:quinone reductase-like Zn-dependent oxidoreductase
MSNKNNSIIYPLSVVAAGAGLLLISRKLWQPRLKLEGQVVLITGGSRGLGLAMAEEFARHGARLVVCARDERELKRAEAILSETGAEVMALQCDLTEW